MPDRSRPSTRALRLAAPPAARGQRFRGRALARARGPPDRCTAQHALGPTPCRSWSAACSGRSVGGHPAWPAARRHPTGPAAARPRQALPRSLRRPPEPPQPAQTTALPARSRRSPAPTSGRSCARRARPGTPTPPTAQAAAPAQAATGPGGAAQRRSSGPGPAGKTACSPANSLAGLQGQPVHLSAGQILVPLIEVPARVRRRLVCAERVFIAVQLVEDPLQRLPVHQMGGVDEGSGLVDLDGFDGLSDEPVVHFGAGLVLAREPHAQTEHAAASQVLVTPCSHSMCCTSTSNHTYL